jgi:predicted HicB family RNase H-like nuclease
MDYIINVRVPTELLHQAKHAAASLGMADNYYLQETLREKVARWVRDEVAEAMICDKVDFVSSRAKLPDELLSQSERAAASLGLSVEEFLQQALQEKVNRQSQDLARKQEIERITEHLFAKNADLYRRLAEWPTAESASK